MTRACEEPSPRTTANAKHTAFDHFCAAFSDVISLAASSLTKLEPRPPEALGACGRSLGSSHRSP